MWINILSVLFSSLEAALKRRPRAIEAKIKQLMSAQFKTHLAVHGDGRTMVEKMTVWETHVQLWIYSNAIVGLQRITFLGFKFDLRFLRILKLLHIYIFLDIISLIFVSLSHFRPIFPFYTRVEK